MNTPKLRFKEFTEQYKSYKLKELSEKKNQKNSRSEISEVFTNSASQGVIPQRDFFDRDIANQNNLSGYYIIEQDDFVYNPRISNLAPVGPIKRNHNGTGVMSPLYTVFGINSNFNKSFAEFYFSTNKWHKYLQSIANYGVRADRMNITSDGFFSMPIFLPSLEEQQKIASFFTAVDQKFTTLKKKKELLEQYKNGVMQQIFSQKLRFKDENGNPFPEWEEKKLGEVLVSISTKKHQIKSTEISETGNYRVVDQGQDSIAGYYNDGNKKFTDFPVIVFGDHTTILKYVDFEFIVGADGTKLLKNKNNDNLKFLYYNLTFNNVKQEGYKRHFTILSEKYLQIPSSKEQQKIADFLSAIDNKIDTVAKQIDKTEQWKKGLLQKMFV